MRFNLKEFYNEIGSKYPEEEVVYKTVSGIVRKEFILSKLRLVHGSILDAGCNDGLYLKQVTKYNKSVGIDISSSLIQKAKNSVPCSSFIIGDIRNLPIKCNSLDNILCTEVLEHIPEYLDCIEELFRILKPKGTLILTTPNFTVERPKWVWFGVLEHYGIEKRQYFHTAFKPEELKVICEKKGFIIEEYGSFEKEVVYINWVGYPILSLLFMLRTIIKSYKFMELTWSFERGIYRFIKLCKLSYIFEKNVKEGKRSYVIAKKKL